MQSPPIHIEKRIKKRIEKSTEKRIKKGTGQGASTKRASIANINKSAKRGKTMSEAVITSDSAFNGTEVVAALNQFLRLRTTPIGMKMFKTREDMEAVPRIRRPKHIHTTDQIVGQAARNGWTVGITMDDLVGAQCGTVIGLHPRSEEWLSGDRMAGVWYSNQDEAASHQAAMDVLEYGRYEAMAVSPLASGRLDPPDICLIYATPAQMILFINGLQWTGYKKLQWGCVGESSCADSWGRALKTSEPSLSIPCFAERRYGGVQDDELLMAIPPDFLPKTVAGLQALSKNGLRYPIAPYGVNNDVREGMGVSYSG